MSFLNPLLLFGALAVSIPVVIHLVNQKKFQQMRWAAMRFLQASVRRTRQKSKIEDLILLLLRCLLVLALCLAFSKPALKRNIPIPLTNLGQTVTVLLIDHSMSMTASDGFKTSFELAVESATEKINALPPGSAVALLLVSDTVQEIVTEPTSELDWVKAALKDLKPVHRKSDFRAGLDRAFQILRIHPGAKKELVLFTDGQSSAWKDFENWSALLKKETDIARTLILVRERGIPNHAVTDLRLAEGPLIAGRMVRLEAQVLNSSAQPLSGFPVHLQTAEGTVLDQAAIPQLAPGESKSVSLFAKLPKVGLNRFEIVLPSDGLKVDNSRPLVLPARKAIEVLVVNGQPNAERRLNETFFLEHALRPISKEQAQDYFLSVRLVEPQELAAARLNEYQVLILANVPSLESQAGVLENFVRQGGVLIFFPGSNQSSATSGRLEELVLPGKYSRIIGNAADEEKFFHIDVKEKSHPIVSLWKDANAGTLNSARFFQSLEIQLPTAGPIKTNTVGGPDFTRPVLQFENGQIALAERSIGAGKVFQFASTADTEWNDLPVRPTFVPLLHQMILYGVQKDAEKFNVLAGADFVEKASLQLSSREIAVTHQGTNAGSARVEVNDGWPTIRFGKTDLSGFYRLTDGASMQTEFAVQTIPEESNLTFLSVPQLERLAEVFEVSRNKQLLSKKPLLFDQQGRELWFPVMLAVLAIAALEMMLGFWFSRPK